MLFALGLLLLLVIGSAMFWLADNDWKVSTTGAIFSFVGLSLVIFDSDTAGRESLRKAALEACELAPTKGVATCEARVVVSLKDGRPTGLSFAPLAKTDAP